MWPRDPSAPASTRTIPASSCERLSRKRLFRGRASRTGGPLLSGALVAASVTALLAASVTAALARPFVLVDVDSGAVIEHEDAFRPWAPASLTKLMTALVAFREIEAGRAALDTPVVMSAGAAAQPASKMYWKPGTTITLKEAIDLLIVKSANDVASAVAETLGGTEQRFVAMMNEQARRLGMTGTTFRNPHGLPDAEQVTNGRDMAILGRAIRTGFPQYDPVFRLEAVDTGRGAPILGYNLMLGRYLGADGMKTGFICASGFNVVTTATRGGRTVLAVVMGAPSQERRAEIAVEGMERAFAAEPGEVTLATLEPYGDRVTPTDLRSEICNAEARSQRYDGRDVEGRMVLDTELITPREREPVTASIDPFPPLPEPREKPATLASLAPSDEGADASEPIPFSPLDGAPAPGTPLPLGRPGTPLPWNGDPGRGEPTGTTAISDDASAKAEADPRSVPAERTASTGGAARALAPARPAKPLPRLPRAARSFAPPATAR